MGQARKKSLRGIQALESCSSGPANLMTIQARQGMEQARQGEEIRVSYSKHMHMHKHKHMNT